MNDPRYHAQPLLLGLNVRRRARARRFRRMLLALAVPTLVILAWWDGKRDGRSEPRPQPLAQSTPSGVPLPMPPDLSRKLAETRVEAALAKLDHFRPDEALALLVTALGENPTAADARRLAARILRETTWHFPLWEHVLPAAVDHIAPGPDDSLWVATGGDYPTVALWDTDAMRVTRVLFPVAGETTRSLVVDPTGRRLVVQRAGVLLLCDAAALKPLCDLGKLPESATPGTTILFSDDGLLMAHLTKSEEPHPAWVWQIRETGTGDLLRNSEPVAIDAPPPLSGHLSRSRLRVLHGDGRVVDIPVSPVKPETCTLPDAPLQLLHACHALDGETALALADRGPHTVPELIVLPPDREATAILDEMALPVRFPWSRYPGVWTGLLRDPAVSPLHVEGTGLAFMREAAAPIFAPARIGAVALQDIRCVIGCEDGMLMLQLRLPPPSPCKPEVEAPASIPDTAALAALRDLSAALAALVHEPDERRFVMVEAAERRSRLKGCDFMALKRMFPDLNFQPLQQVLAEHMAPAALAAKADDAPLRERLARAGGVRLAPRAAASLVDALAAGDAGRIRKNLAAAEDAPPLIRRLAESRIAWLEDRRGDAVASWPDGFPSIAEVRLREDWDGWEQVDILPALERLRRDVESELAKLELPADHDAQGRQALLALLTDPETLRTVGRRRLATACLDAALVLSGIHSEAQNALTLASLARTHGAAPDGCLRAEARALSHLGDHTKAHDRWILLLTEYPVASHQSADYADAAYTAFEVGDPRQAMEILTSGMQRFPDDAHFALRAGWIALLTGNPERGYGYLLAGRQIGYTEDCAEHATVLLTIAAAQSGHTDDAAQLFEELAGLNEAWRDPDIIENLNWPEEMKSTLRQLTW